MAEVLYSFPNQKDFHRITGQEQALAADSNSSAFVYKAFDESVVFGIDSQIQNLGLELPPVLWKTPINFDLDPPSKKVYLERLNQLINHLKDKELQKVVFSRPKIEALRVKDITRILSNLRARYPKAFVYALNSERFGQWIGASPETLLVGHKDVFQTVSLAGTKAIGVTSWTNKEIEEQSLVTDYIVSTLKMNAATDLELLRTETVNAGPVDHLLTKIKFKYSGSALKLAEELSPTPAVCGLPKLAALQYIRDHENYDRSLYSSFIGFTSPDSNNLYVNLRCMQLGSDAVCLYLGGGITAQSIAENEWDETLLKSKTLLDIL